MAKHSYFKDSLRESLFRNVGMPYRNLIGLLLGTTASLLPLTSGIAGTGLIAGLFVALLVLTIVGLIWVRPTIEREVDRFAWGLVVIIVLGFGFGGILYQYRAWLKWLWNQYRRINEPHELVLESLFLLGVILGVFVVRNWAKEQKAFQDSLTGILSGVFVSAVLGDVLAELTPMRALAYYALGFTMSGTLNVILAARLTAHYTNKRSITSRAVLDFLYGSERAKIIDEYFLKNFKDDPDYAKARIIDTLNAFRKLAAREFANGMEKRRKSRQRARQEFIKGDKQKMAGRKAIQYEKEELQTELGQLAGQSGVDNRVTEINERVKELEKLAGQLAMASESPIIEILGNRHRQLEPCSQRKAANDELKRLLSEKNLLASLAKRSRKQTLRLEEIDSRIPKLQQQILELSQKCSDHQYDEWLNLEQLLNSLKPSYFYWLMAIECEEEDGDATADTETAPKDRPFSVLYREIASDEGPANPPESTVNHSPKKAEGISDDMFRIGVSIRWRDNLEYIVAPGKYGASFPVFDSVAGLALIFEQIIIMDRDRQRKFRNNERINGICPQDIEQDRGLDEIDFLSYISIPVINPFGVSSERGVGIVNLDTRLFATRSPLNGEPVTEGGGIFRTRLSPRDLTEFANNLYEQYDEDVRHIDGLTGIIMPVMVLYAKCRVGAT